MFITSNIKYGDRFGLLTAISEFKCKLDKKIYIICKCDCGNISSVQKWHLIAGKTISCGCEIVRRNKEVHTKHGMSRSKMYQSWLSMKQRCCNPNFEDFHNYGGRGITICDRWLMSFENFLFDMGLMPENGNYTLERINNNKGYYPDNCKWETFKNQQRNRRNNHVISYNGESLTVAEWGDRTGIKPNTILIRIRRGWSIESALSRI